MLDPRFKKMTELFQSISERGRDSLFLSFEGIDGSGKSTQIKLFEEELKSNNYNVFTFREPGATPLGEKLRNLILKSEEKMDPFSEALIFLTSRIENLKVNILPLLKEDRTIVLMDRFIDSTLSYQCYGRKLSLESLMAIHTQGVLKYLPDLTFYLDIDFETSLDRRDKRAREKDYFEKEKNEFMRNVLNGYREIELLFPDRIKKVNANNSPEDVFEQIMRIWKERA